MTKEIITVKESLETKIESTVMVMEEGLKKSKAEHEAQQKNLMDNIVSLKKQVTLNAEAHGKIEADQESLKQAVQQIDEILELGKEEHEMTAADIKDLKEYM